MNYKQMKKKSIRISKNVFFIHMKTYSETWNALLTGRIIQDDSKHIDTLAQFRAHATF